MAALAYYEPALPQPPPQPKWSDALRDAAAKYKGENKFDLNEFTGEERPLLRLHAMDEVKVMACASQA